MPRYIVRGRSSYHLQRRVPNDCSEALGRSKWTDPGRSLSDARAKVPAFLARIDREIREARGEQLSPEERLIQQGQVPGMLAGDLVDFAAPHVGLHLEQDPGSLLRTALGLAKAVQKGERRAMTTEGLLMHISTKTTALTTFEGWSKALGVFMKHSGRRPGLCTSEDALNYIHHLLVVMGRSSAKTQVAYLSGLWTTLLQRERGSEHIGR